MVCMHSRRDRKYNEQKTASKIHHPKTGSLSSLPDISMQRDNVLQKWNLYYILFCNLLKRKEKTDSKINT